MNSDPNLIAYARTVDRMLAQIFEPPRVCMECGRPMAVRGLCEECREAKEQDEIETARHNGNY